jgi:hypothetical protein
LVTESGAWADHQRKRRKTKDIYLEYDSYMRELTDVQFATLAGRRAHISSSQASKFSLAHSRDSEGRNNAEAIARAHDGPLVVRVGAAVTTTELDELKRDVQMSDDAFVGDGIPVSIMVRNMPQGHTCVDLLGRLVDAFAPCSLGLTMTLTRGETVTLLQRLQANEEFQAVVKKYLRRERKYKFEVRTRTSIRHAPAASARVQSEALRG